MTWIAECLSAHAAVGTKLYLRPCDLSGDLKPPYRYLPGDTLLLERVNRPHESSVITNVSNKLDHLEVDFTHRKIKAVLTKSSGKHPSPATPVQYETWVIASMVPYGEREGE